MMNWLGGGNETATRYRIGADRPRPSMPLRRRADHRRLHRWRVLL